MIQDEDYPVKYIEQLLTFPLVHFNSSNDLKYPG
jgi:hypothetical protein